MKRRHRTSFGAECEVDGEIRFRLWAPGAHQVDLCLGFAESDSGQAARRLPMVRANEGWFEIITDLAKPGSMYKFQVDRGQEVPDPASRFQPQDVHGPSQVVDACAFEWRDENWRGRRWEEAVLYELHVGTFTPAGTFSAAKERLDYLADVGITAIELMPLSDFPGKRNWGYDGVLPFAPDSVYGRPEDLKDLIQSAHARGIMVLLDVVYNHFGPEGNYLGLYAPQFFTARHKTPWGNAINFDGAEGRPVRDFFIQNALYWLNEYHFDGLRLDAVHTIVDDSTPHILDELATTVRNNISDRHIHLVLENERNQATYLRRNENCRPRAYNAQWDDDIHHTLHVLTTGERDGYYSDYADHPLEQLGRCLTSGFAYQGDVSHYSNGERRGESTAGLPLTAFISFLQNHDQIGNRAFGDRITTIAEPRAVRAATEILLLAPSIPLLFMGEEFGAATPFLFFCNFEKGLAEAVSAGRRNEFARFTHFGDAASGESIPDPNAESTFERSKLDWEDISQPSGKEWLALHRNLLRIRREFISPRSLGDCRTQAKYEVLNNQGLQVQWNFSDGAQLTLLVNLSPSALSDFPLPSGETIYFSKGVLPDGEDGTGQSSSSLPSWSVRWALES